MPLGKSSPRGDLTGWAPGREFTQAGRHKTQASAHANAAPNLPPYRDGPGAGENRRLASGQFRGHLAETQARPFDSARRLIQSSPTRGHDTDCGQRPARTGNVVPLHPKAKPVVAQGPRPAGREHSPAHTASPRRPARGRVRRLAPKDSSTRPPAGRGPQRKGEDDDRHSQTLCYLWAHRGAGLC